ncbi:DUF1294 domain-containing protein [Porticoccaceae bacterium LTM1]|nr:DUF1294 domain-containing protein [Porticoccaceae bacterium LTM1]
MSKIQFDGYCLITNDKGRNFVKWHSTLLLLLTAGLAFSYFNGFTPLLISLLFVLVSGVAFFAYRKDKRAAQDGLWRIPENNLHLLGLGFGWPGALLAQQRFRHKTKKLSFQIVFWLTVVVNLSAIVWLHTDRGHLFVRKSCFQIENLGFEYINSRTGMDILFFFTHLRG